MTGGILVIFFHLTCCHVFTSILLQHIVGDANDRIGRENRGSHTVKHPKALWCSGSTPIVVRVMGEIVRVGGRTWFDTWESQQSFCHFRDLSDNNDA